MVPFPQPTTAQVLPRETHCKCQPRIFARLDAAYLDSVVLFPGHVRPENHQKYQNPASILCKEEANVSPATPSMPSSRPSIYENLPPERCNQSTKQYK
jgi:hypothetical protein